MECCKNYHGILILVSIHRQVSIQRKASQEVFSKYHYGIPNQLHTLDLQCNALALVFVLFKGLKLKAPSSALLPCCTAALCSFSPARAEVVAAGERLLPLGLLLLLLDLSNLRNGTR